MVFKAVWKSSVLLAWRKWIFLSAVRAFPNTLWVRVLPSKTFKTIQLNDLKCILSPLLQVLHSLSLLMMVLDAVGWYQGVDPFEKDPLFKSKFVDFTTFLFHGNIYSMMSLFSDTDAVHYTFMVDSILQIIVGIILIIGVTQVRVLKISRQNDEKFGHSSLCWTYIVYGDVTRRKSRQ